MAYSASRVRLSVVAAGVMLLATSRAAVAQDARPPAAVETWVGYGWVDDSGNHGLVGGGMRFYVSPRVSLGPRVTFERTFREMPDDHIDLDLETVLTFEFRRPAHRARALFRRSSSSAAAFGCNAFTSPVSANGRAPSASGV